MQSRLRCQIGINAVTQEGNHSSIIACTDTDISLYGRARHMRRWIDMTSGASLQTIITHRNTNAHSFVFRCIHQMHEVGDAFTWEKTEHALIWDILFEKLNSKSLFKYTVKMWTDFFLVVCVSLSSSSVDIFLHSCTHIRARLITVDASLCACKLLMCLDKKREEREREKKKSPNSILTIQFP